MRYPRSVRATSALGLVFLPSLAMAAGGAFAGVSLAVSKETAAPGALAQMKVSITEPKPISTGSASVDFAAFDSLVGIALFSPTSDTAGIALVQGSSMKLALVSAGGFGTSVDYPILTVAGRVPPGTPAGTKFPLTVDPAALQLADLAGAAYPVDVKPGHLVAGPYVSIGDVTPGSARLPVGSVVTIRGSNFVPGTRVKFSEARLSEVRYVDPTRIDVVLAQPATMLGMMIKAGNPDGSASTYFSYQRTRPTAVSADPVLSHAVPLPPGLGTTNALLAFDGPAPSVTYGVAVQNVQTAETMATFEIIDASGVVLAVADALVPAASYAVWELSELFGFAPDGPVVVQVTSATPLQVVGAVADQVAGTAVPVMAR